MISAAKPDLLEEVRGGRFREDLLYRLNVAELHIPEGSEFVGQTIDESGLRERDITILTLHRSTDVIPNPKPTRVLEADDRLTCFGKLEEMRGMIPTRRKRRAKVRKLPADALDGLNDA